MANSLTYKNLYSQVLQLIKESMVYPVSTVYGGGQLNRTQVISTSPFTTSGIDYDIAKVNNDVLNLLGKIVPNRIKTGLIVKETSPISNRVDVTAGEGIVDGRVYSLNKDVVLTIPFDSTNSIFYVNLFINGVEISTTTSSNRLALAKIIVPNPGVTSLVQNNRESVTQVNAYIVTLREITLFGDDKGIFNEDTIDVIKDNFREIAAETIIGTLTLDESLKISNVAGTLELDSNSMTLKNAAGTTSAKFNRNGTFFYDDDGAELAKFSVDGARVGNIVITKNSIESGNFVTGNTGFKISDNGDVEFDSATIRGTIYATSGEIGGISITNNSLASSNFSSGALGSGFSIQSSGDAVFNNIYLRGEIGNSIFEKDVVSIVGGNLLVMGGDILTSDMTALDSSTLTTSGDTTFSVGDILRIKDSENDEWMEITAVNGSTYTVTRDKYEQYSSNSNPAWKEGTAIVNYGSSGDGGIYMTSSETNAPYLSVIKHDGSPWSSLTTALRLGNLNGFLGYSSDLYGIAIGTSDDYLKYDPVNGLLIKGSITITGGNASVTYYQATEPGSSGDSNTPKDGDYWVDTDDNNKLYVYDSNAWNAAGAEGLTTFRQSSIPTATNDGDLWIDTDDQKMYRATAQGDDEITTGEWELIDMAIATGWSHVSDTTKIDGGTIYTGTIVADSIAANTITANEIAASTITATEMNVSQLSAISANLGTITAGTVTGATIQTASSGARVVMNTSALTAYDAVQEVFKVEVSGDDVGDVTIGDYSDNKGLLFDASADTFTFKGALYATSGDFAGTVNVGTAGRVYIDGANEVIKVYDASSNLMVEIGKLS